MTAANLTSNHEARTVRFRQANAHTQLIVLHYLAKQLHQVSRSAAPSAFFSQRVQAVLKQISQLPREERQAVLEEILTGAPTRLTEAYEDLDTNMRMAFWYRLVNGRKGDSLLPSSILPQEMNYEQRSLLSDLESRDSNELVTFLREAVSVQSAA